MRVVQTLGFNAPFHRLNFSLCDFGPGSAVDDGFGEIGERTA